ncbi:hypothetical protein [Mucilaginibacter gilvus]|uniref:Uncharacterized protein n=1 Tax=Mucilaginibacter gilvus TaxID=2305909 RepID=A0A3S3UN88_9SPHI|nr:hypothetical protein [Mucilaginibacter gilvus]RWY50350.1 hypothetical protein EPL05_16545 [Mucilaginibacter gilvus]
MEDPELKVFSILFREAYSRCFGVSLTQPLTETEGKLFQQQLLDHTGLMVGWRSLKNYSLFLLSEKEKENPSVASMDTLARYVLKSPYTNELERKRNESHHPYWFIYRERHLANAISPDVKLFSFAWVKPILAAVLLLLAAYTWYQRKSTVYFADNFKDVGDKAMTEKEWQVLNKDDIYWPKHGDIPKALTLFTLTGDNWPDSTSLPQIKNLVIRSLPRGCFVTELHIEDFIPAAEWQQAGLLLMEDTSVNSPSIRLSLAYNDFFGGFNKPQEILVQAIASPGAGGKPEEFVHSTVLTLDSTVSRSMVSSNLKKTALRIEKKGNSYRLLYAGGAGANSAFKELATKEVGITPAIYRYFRPKRQGARYTCGAG